MLDLWRTEGVTTSATDSPASVEPAPSSRMAVLVAVQAEAVVGVLIAALDGWRGNMHRLAVLPAHRCRGIALALVTEGERRLAAAGAQRITALIESDHGWAVGFWESAGYARDSRMGDGRRCCDSLVAVAAAANLAHGGSVRMGR